MSEQNTPLVLVVDKRPDVQELNRVLLSAEGYVVESQSYDRVTAEWLTSMRPPVVLVDLLPRDEAPWQLLRLLRDTEATREAGIVVTSDLPELVERALADTSLGVAQGLVMPFDLDHLYAAVAAALRDGRKSPPPVQPLSPLLLRASEALRQHRQRVLVRWVQRLSTFDVFHQKPDLTLREIQGYGAELLDGVVQSLALQAAMRAIPSMTAGICVDVAHDHARLRREQGVATVDLAREIAALRREIWRELRLEIARAEIPPLDDVWSLQTRVQVALDESLYAMLEA